MTRDMTTQQFGAALKRIGFRRSPMPMFAYYIDTTGKTDTQFPAILNRDCSINRRATIAYLIKGRANAVGKAGG